MKAIPFLLLWICLCLLPLGCERRGSGALSGQGESLPTGKSLLTDTLSPLYKQARELFDQARDFQEKEDYASAIPVYQRLIRLDPGFGPDMWSERVRAVADLMDEGCLQLVYCYIFSGVRGDGADFFGRFYAGKEGWMVRERPRSVEICYAYALYEATRLDEAVALVDKALSREEPGRSEDRLYVDNGIASVIYNQAGKIREAIECGERSRDILRGMEERGKIVSVLGNLIYQYQQVGEFDKALAAYEELTESGEGEKNPYALCTAEVNMVHLYDEWGIDDEVRLHLRKAREAAVRSGVADAFLRVDNLAAYYALANGDDGRAASLLDSLAARMPPRSQDSYYHAFYDNYRCVLSVRASGPADKAAVTEARRWLDRLRGAPLNNLSLLGCRLLGEALADRGEKALAIEAYRMCDDYVRENHLLNQQRLVYGALGELYREEGDYARSATYLSLARQADSAFTERRGNRLLAQFRARYEIREKEQANQLLQSEIRMKERTLRLYLWLGASLALLLLLFLSWLGTRQRAAAARHEADLHRHELDEARHKESLRLIEEKEAALRQTLAERQALNRQNMELLARIDMADAREAMQALVNSLSPRLLTAEEELEFRRQFLTVYPAFLLRLREACPAVTRGEELLAMLLRLNLSSEEIALVLGNSRTSVNTARFRLRKKLGMERERSIESFLAGL